MKKENKLFAWLACFALLASAACSDMNELGDKFLDKGATIYAAKVDSAGANTGNKRIQIVIYVRTQRINFVRVYWNNYSDSSDIQVGNTPGVYAKFIDIPNPSLYTFYLVSYDSYNNPSLPYEVVGTVIGDEFAVNLSNRRVTSAAFDDVFVEGDPQLVLSIANQPDYALYSELQYTNQQGDKVAYRVEETTAHTLSIDDYDKVDGLRMVTYFKANETAIDTIKLETEVAVKSPAYSRSIETGLNLGTASGCSYTNHGDYVELVSTSDDPYMYTNGLPEDVTVASIYRVIYKVEYQSDRLINNWQLFYGRTGAASGVSTDENLVFENTGLDATDEARWKLFVFDCEDAINRFSWGAVGHRFRFDFVGYGVGAGPTIYVRKMWFDIWTLE